MPNIWHPVPGCAKHRAGNPRTWDQKFQNLITLPVLFWCSLFFIVLALYIIQFPLIREGIAKRTFLCLARRLYRPGTNLHPLQKQLKFTTFRNYVVLLSSGEADARWVFYGGWGWKVSWERSAVVSLEDVTAMSPSGIITLSTSHPVCH